MKRSLFILSALGLSAAMALSLSACSDYDVFDESKVAIQATVNEYYTNFVARYGVPDPNHDWGFDDQEVMTSYAKAATRAYGDAGVNTNRNQWTDWDSGSNKFKDDALAKDIQVPGWPNFDGYYYASDGKGSLEAIIDESTWKANPGNYQTVGDVTDYEIQYVSAWFRSHKDPVSIDLHLTDFFVQNISCDNDQLQYTGSVTGNGPSSLVTGKNGENVIYVNDVVEAGTNNHKSGVAAQVEHQPDHLNSNERVNYSMDYLHFKPMGASGDTPGSSDGGNGWTHINNFNNGSTNSDPESKTKNPNRTIMYVTSSGTEKFACRPSMTTQSLDNAWIDKYVLVHLTWNETGKDGEVHEREGYYLGFDFRVETNDTKVSYDGYYSNWIIKITPGHFTPTTDKKRVMCEDLGSTFDFDFDDVVFDVAYPSETEALITLQAAGGTLPIYVGKHEAAYEAHKLLGNPAGDYTPVNVGQGNEHVVAIYRVPCTSTTKNAKYIPIWVENGSKTYQLTGKLNTTPDGMDDDDYLATVDGISIIAVNENTYVISDKDPRNNKEGNVAPRRFAVPNHIQWLKETKFIEKAYQYFSGWVQDATKRWKDGSGVDRKWYEHTYDTDILYKYKINASGSAGSATQLFEWTDLVPDPTVSFASTLGIKSWLNIETYTGQSAVKKAFDTDNASAITMTIVFTTTARSSTDAEADDAKKLNVSLVPAQITTGEGLNISAINKTPSTWENAEARWAAVGDYSTSYTPTNYMYGYSEGGKHVYTVSFSMTKEEFIYKYGGGAAGADKYIDFLLLYVDPVSEVSASDVSVAHWFVHY